MRDAMAIWESICRSQWFRYTSIVGELAFVLARRRLPVPLPADPLLEQLRLVRKEGTALANQKLFPSEPSATFWLYSAAS